jgi:hypothetical protein
MAEQLPNKMQDGMGNAVSSSIEEVRLVRNILTSEFAILRKEITDLSASICKKILYANFFHQIILGH